jgi:hypothetical protein
MKTPITQRPTYVDVCKAILARRLEMFKAEQSQQQPEQKSDERRDCE